MNASDLLAYYLHRLGLSCYRRQLVFYCRQAGAPRRHGSGDPCHVDSDSVICFGTARIVENLDERERVLNEFNRCLRPGAEAIAREEVEGCAAVEIHVHEMTGRRERARKRTHWRYCFHRPDGQL